MELTSIMVVLTYCTLILGIVYVALCFCISSTLINEVFPQLISEGSAVLTDPWFMTCICSSLHSQTETIQFWPQKN